MKQLFAICLIILGIIGCGNPEPPNKDTTGRSVPDSTRTPTVYEFIDYDLLYEIITVDLEVPDEGIALPGTNPAGYLRTHKYTLGAPNYEGENSDEMNPGEFTSVGMKHWIVAVNSACGIAAERDWTTFYDDNIDVTNLDPMFIRWLGRYPTNEEEIIFEEMHDDLYEAWAYFWDHPELPRATEIKIATQNLVGRKRRKTVANCTTILTTLEFLESN